MQSKREANNARTRERLLDAAVSLYGTRSIDTVSLREIGIAAGQRNPNALQYHFGDRDGLLQAIVDRHTAAIGERREHYFQRAEAGEWAPAEAFSRALVMPVLDYAAQSDAAVDFICIVSQLASASYGLFGLGGASPVTFFHPPGLTRLFAEAFPDLPTEVAQQRIYLIVDTVFHATANIFRASELLPGSSPLADRDGMCQQLLGMVQSFAALPGTQQG